MIAAEYTCCRDQAPKRRHLGIVISFFLSPRQSLSLLDTDSKVVALGGGVCHRQAGTWSESSIPDPKSGWLVCAGLVELGIWRAGLGCLRREDVLGSILV